MKYRVVRRPGEQDYLVQVSWCFGLFRDYERDFSIKWPPMPGRPYMRFSAHADAQAYVDKCLEQQRDPGQKWPWQPTSYY